MNHIKNIVNNIIKSSNQQENWKNCIMQNWTDIIGNLASKVCIERIYNDTIILAVNDSCWMQELHALSDIIKTKINQTLTEPRIKTIRFKYATKKTSFVHRTQNFTSILNQNKILSSQEQKALESISDPELSQALIRFLQKCHQSS